MRLFFLRHATASDDAPNDAARELTREGREESRIAGAALARLGIEPSRILASPLVRAQQTAEIAAKALKYSGEIESMEELRNGTSTRELLAALHSFADGDSLLLVGHMPSLSEHIAVLIDAKRADGLPMGKAGAACVELESLREGRGELRWLMRHKQLAHIAK